MRKVCLLGLLLLAFAIPASAQAYCFGTYPYFCQYLEDDGFSMSSGSPWSFSSGASRSSTTNTCINESTYAAVLAPGASVHQYVNTDEHPKWAVELDVFFSSSAGNSDDKITVQVSNITFFNSTESFNFNATQYGNCAQIYIPLRWDYSNSEVRVHVKRYAGSTMSSIAVDNVLLWGGDIN